MGFFPKLGQHQLHTKTKSPVFHIKVTTLDYSRPWPAHPSGLATSEQKANPSGATCVHQITLIKFNMQIV